jgi:hypothetical protein
MKQLACRERIAAELAACFNPGGEISAILNELERRRAASACADGTVAVMWYDSYRAKWENLPTSGGHTPD